MDPEKNFLQGMSDGFGKEAGLKSGLKAIASKVVGAAKAGKEKAGAVVKRHGKAAGAGLVAGGLLGRLLGKKAKKPAEAPEEEKEE